MKTPPPRIRFATRRIERHHREDAAEILDLVRRMPKPMQDVVVRRAAGNALEERRHGAARPGPLLASGRLGRRRSSRLAGGGDSVRRLV
ncbi:hypothetical protein [Ensifer sp. BR816]|uniref:hypothetical protein n=1 Tax=Rhizobium sp. (strain BR816) TaxID=1057002 RepID=UPI0003749FE1|nr:hypothetical protein [Ensifer sp. BR816]